MNNKKLLISLSTILLSLSTIGLSINSTAKISDNSVFSNPQGILSVQFADNIYINNIIDNVLPTDPESKNRYGITSINGLSKIGDSEQLIAVTGEYSTKQAKRQFKKELSTYLAKLDVIKDQGTSNLNVKQDDNSTKPLDDQTKELLTNEINKLSKSDITSSRWSYL